MGREMRKARRRAAAGLVLIVNGAFVVSSERVALAAGCPISGGLNKQAFVQRGLGTDGDNHQGGFGRIYRLGRSFTTSGCDYNTGNFVAVDTVHLAARMGTSAIQLEMGFEHHRTSAGTRFMRTFTELQLVGTAEHSSPVLWSRWRDPSHLDSMTSLPDAPCSQPVGGADATTFKIDMVGTVPQTGAYRWNMSMNCSGGSTMLLVNVRDTDFKMARTQAETEIEFTGVSETNTDHYNLVSKDSAGTWSSWPDMECAWSRNLGGIRPKKIAADHWLMSSTGSTC